MTEQEKLDYYELHGCRPPENYVFYRLCYKSGKVIDRTVQKFGNSKEAREHAQELAESSTDSGRITLLFVDRRPESDECVSQDFEELLQMFWPVSVKDAVEMYFEVL